MGEESGQADESIEEILDTIGDEMARRVLTAVSQEPQSARELSEKCDMSLPTVYRRTEALIEHGLLNERTVVAEDGNHYKVFEPKFETTVISLSDSEFNVKVYREDNLPDRFSELWEDLSGS